MTAQPEITQRDLRNRSKEIMDAVENGQAFTVTRDGHRIGELIPCATAAASSRGRNSPRYPAARPADLMIAAIAIAIAIAEDLPVLTTNPDDFSGLENLLAVVPVTRPRRP